MKKIAVEEERRSRLHFTLYQLQMPQCLVYPFDVSSLLLARLSMINTAHMMRSLDDFKAAVVRRCAINLDQAAGHVGEETMIEVPVAIILVPLPCPAHQRCV